MSNDCSGLPILAAEKSFMVRRFQLSISSLPFVSSGGQLSHAGDKGQFRRYRNCEQMARLWLQSWEGVWSLRLVIGLPESFLLTGHNGTKLTFFFFSFFFFFHLKQFLNLGTIRGWGVSFCGGGLSCALEAVCQHPRPLFTGCQGHPWLWQPELSPDCARCSQAEKLTLPLVSAIGLKALS